MSQEPDDRSTERRTHSEEFLIEARSQRIANLQTQMQFAIHGVPILRDPEPHQAEPTEKG